jgi:hypothetical protein
MQEKENNPFTKDEEEVMNLIVQAHNKFLKLDRCHPMEVQEWVSGVHKLQSILSHRVMKRNYPKYFT